MTNSMSPYTAVIGTQRLAVNTSGGAVTVNLPAASAALGNDWTIMKTTGDANAVTINRNGADTIQGDTSETLSNQYESLVLSAVSSGVFAIV